MKEFWIALFLLLAITLGVFLSSCKVSDSLDTLRRTLEEDRYSEAAAIWERRRLLFTLTLDREALGQIEERLAALQSAASLGDRSDIATEKAKLLKAISRLKESVTPSLADIF